VLSDATARALHAHVLDELERLLAGNACDAARLVAVGSGTQRQSRHAEGSYNDDDDDASDPREARWDVRLDQNEPLVRAALAELLGNDAALGAALEALGGGGKAKRALQLWELAAIVSVPGCEPQIVHADAMWSPEPLLLTAFVALQPVTREMGPTRFLPRTHAKPGPAAVVATTDATRLVEADGMASNKKGGSSAAPPASWVGLLDAGDAALYDGRLLHCGGANRADRPRALLYVTFRAVEDAGEDEVDGVTTLASLRRSFSD